MTNSLTEGIENRLRNMKLTVEHDIRMSTRGKTLGQIISARDIDEIIDTFQELISEVFDGLEKDAVNYKIMGLPGFEEAVSLTAIQKQRQKLSEILGSHND